MDFEAGEVVVEAMRAVIAWGCGVLVSGSCAVDGDTINYWLCGSVGIYCVYIFAIKEKDTQLPPL
jgi:hypothetical protein